MFSPWTLTEYELVYGLWCEGIAPLGGGYTGTGFEGNTNTTKFIPVVTEQHWLNCFETGNFHHFWNFTTAIVALYGLCIPNTQQWLA